MLARLLTPIILLCSLLASPAFATMTLGVHTSKQTNSTLATATDPLTTTTGSGLIAGFQYQPNDTVVSIVDTYHNVWAEIQSEFYNSFGVKSRAWVCFRCTGGANHIVTITDTLGISQTIYLTEIKASLGNGIILDNSGRQADLASPFTSPATPTSVANEFLWAMAVSGAGTTGDVFTAGNSFTMDENQTDSLNGVGGAIGHRIVTSTGTYNSSWTAAVSTQTGQWIATFSETPTATGQLLTDFNVRTEPTLPVMGAAGSKVTDPTFNTTILRVTDANDGAWATTPYSTYPSINANSTRVMATVAPISNNKFWLLNANTFTVSGGALANSSASVIAQHFFRWSGTNPDLLYGAGNPSALGVNSARLYSYNVATGITSLIKDFSGLTLAGIAPGNASNFAVLYQMQSSKNDDVFSFNVQRRQNGTDTDVGFLYYKRSTDTVLLNVTNSNTNETYVDKTGSFGYVIIDPYPAVLVYNLGTQTLIATLGSNSGFSHNGVGTGTVFTSTDNCNCMSIRNLATPTTESDWMTGYFTTGGESQHVSFNSNDESYGLVSRFTLSGGGVTNAFDNELLLVSTTGNAVKRIAHHRSITNTYEASPFANISPDEQFVAFTSTWGTNLNSGGRRDLYLVRLPTPDTTPPVLQAAFPTISLPAGTTSVKVSVTSDELATVKYGLSDVAYASLPSTTTRSSLTHTTASITGLTDGSSTPVYFRGQDSALNTDLSSLTVTVNVAAAPADVTPPGNVSGLAATVLDATHISYSWTAATGGDVLQYQLFLCTPDPCTPSVPAGIPVATTQIVASLVANTSYDACVKAYDTSLNPSAACSSTVAATTSAVVDTTPPTPPTNLRISQLVNTNGLLAFTSGTDSGSGVGVHTIEGCSGSLTCSNFVAMAYGSSALIRVPGLTASTAVCFRAYDTDLLGNIGVASNIACGTTTALGVDQLRLPISQARAVRVP